MKKIFTFLMAVIVISAASCKKETVVSPATTTILLTSNSWVEDAASPSYYTDIAVPELDSYYQNNGAVFLYLQDSAGVWEQLPDLFYGVTYRFTYATGHIYIDAQMADGSLPTGGAPPTVLKLKLVLLK